VNILYILGTAFADSSAEKGPPAIMGLPGFRNLEQTKLLSLDGLSMSTLEDFAGLQCAGSVKLNGGMSLMTIEAIANMRVGIDELRLAQTDEGFFISQGYKFSQRDAENSFFFTSMYSFLPFAFNTNNPAFLKPLAKMAGCEGGPVPNSRLLIYAGCSNEYIQSWGTLCRVLQTMDCSVLRAPSPPLHNSPDSP
jgi:hypothetical protein